MSKPELIEVKTRTSGQVVFVIGAFLVSVLLLSQIGSQTEWNDRARTVAAQPRLWPAVALVLMVLGFGLHWRSMRRRRPDAIDWLEVRRWVEPLEFLGWFLIYVLAVPRLGFLPVSLLVACALTWRLGYRTRGALALAAVFAVAITVVFKGLLGVNIPGGQIYDFLPGSIRTFFLVYL
ncbi:tripartite tricarboxylate transporter TctB family protein [Sulfitobacter albidus]|uniref:Tripartite tricarboxylate transporter TctB family protein n=1 Tax=Sulfitobacter albidus TaxID=2829501 RepID=A0A975JGR2_9RHOB|nr:tripartite tricarboxylate transporter TctB family protein [Sulfitobacter albidus]QUJ78226.1 tripartite tricarboxylate transporter TctB family protein [Sulfitobacter albidus]